MKHIGEGLSKVEERIRQRIGGDFPSYEHEIAWMLAEAFNEPYGFWVRNVQYASLNAGQIKHEFENLQGKGFTRRQKAKMLMSIMKVKVRNKHYD